jgi:hypothetical protein
MRQVLSPRSLVQINGEYYVPESWSLEINAHGATNTATIKIPIKGNPDFTQTLFRGNNQAPIPVTVLCGFPSKPAPPKIMASQLIPRFVGTVDSYEPILSATEYEVIFHCRSAAAALIDNKITVPIMGAAQTSVAFLESVTKQFGLQSKTYLPSGFSPVTLPMVFNGTFMYGVHNIRIWDLLLQCAQFDDVDVWESLGTVYYGAPGSIPRNTVNLQWLQDVERLDGSHSPNFNRNIIVVVRTYQAKTRTSVSTRTITNPFTGGGVTVSTVSRTITSQPIFGTTERVSTSISSTGDVVTTTSSTTGGLQTGQAGGSVSETKKERYVFYVRNIDAAHAQALANAKWRQLSMHEYSMSFELPVTTSLADQLSITSLIQLSGHPYSAFNAKYWPRRITENWEPMSTGWTWKIDCVNHVLPQGAV